MIIRVVRLTFHPEKVGEFTAIFAESRALIRGSEGCKGVRLLRDAASPNVFFTISEWESEGHLDTYRHSELFRTTWARTKLLFAAPPLAHSLMDTQL